MGDDWIGLFVQRNQHRVIFADPVMDRQRDVRQPVGRFPFVVIATRRVDVNERFAFFWRPQISTALLLLVTAPHPFHIDNHRNLLLAESPTKRSIALLVPLLLFENVAHR